MDDCCNFSVTAIVIRGLAKASTLRAACGRLPGQHTLARDQVSASYLPTFQPPSKTLRPSESALSRCGDGSF